MRDTVSRSIFAIAMLTLASAAISCDDAEPSIGPSPVAPVSARPTSSASVDIITPKQEEIIKGESTPVAIELKGGKIVPQTSTDLRPDEGHLHVFLDGELVSMTSGTESELTGLTPGQHLLKVEFVANDHAPFDPRIIAAVTFEVEA